MAKGVRFFLLIHRTSQSEVLSPFPYKGRLIENAVCFEAVAYGEIVRFFGTSMAPSPTDGSGNAVRGVAVSYTKTIYIISRGEKKNAKSPFRSFFLDKSAFICYNIINISHIFS